jgi:hypothetical protein
MKHRLHFASCDTGEAPAPTSATLTPKSTTPLRLRLELSPDLEAQIDRLTKLEQSNAREIIADALMLLQEMIELSKRNQAIAFVEENGAQTILSFPKKQ